MRAQNNILNVKNNFLYQSSYFISVNSVAKLFAMFMCKVSIKTGKKEARL